MAHASNPGFASSPLDTKARLQIQGDRKNSFSAHSEKSLKSQSRRASSSKKNGFQFLKAPYLQIQASGTQTLGGNTIGNAQNLGNLSGQSAYSRNDSVGRNNASDFFKFSLSKTSNFKLDLSKQSGNADLWLLKTNGSTLKKSTRSGTRNESIQGNLKAGTYYVQVTTDDASANYSLNLKGSGKSNDAGNAQTKALDAGNISRTQRRYRGQVGGSDTADYYRVDVSEGGSVKLAASGISGDVDLQLLNGNGAAIAKSTNEGKANESINQTVAAGTYFVQVAPFSSAKSNYTLDISSNFTGQPSNPVPAVGSSSSPSPIPSPSPAPTTNLTGDPGNTLSSAEVKSSAAFSRTQQVNNDDQDFYRFNIGQSGVFTANLTGLSGDADVKLIQDKNNNGSVDQGEVLGWQWEWGAGNENIRRFLSAGNYFVEVMGYGTEMKDYTLNTTFNAQSSDDRKFSINLNYKDGLNGISSTVRNALVDAAKIWENVIPSSSFNGAHTLNIDVVGINSSQDWLAAATNTGGQNAANGKWLPTTGTIRLNTSYASTYNNNPDYLKGIVAHELAHVLGIGTIWEKNGNSLINRSTNTYKADSYAGRAYGQVTGTLQPTAVPVESGSYGHWDENTFQNELLTPYAESIGVKMPLSEVTIASLRDLGWNVNYGAAEDFSLSQSINRPDGLMPDAVGTTASATVIAIDSYAPSFQSLKDSAVVSTTGAELNATRCPCGSCATTRTAMGMNSIGSTSFSDAIASSGSGNDITASKWSVI
ncbi:MAG: pre-peptidase C-terminal domain-containing protein [Drouetiella hepatica Uher 2000/2452]|jgi:hypothetical protein|uniref:Pre-peptidase C-terminal domain-containing protein n=1 Tax=Drouetiella hepatica Uher 2000/2452 TaxID=904376 RepID=A0A951ULP8_9CYAN|nr:pre-peptidase C-terminal domain-containing protein [Drouetiella hepatica Uher 2000/2452]